ncbi:efflux transporter periplasmic adaptor subunit [Candidatus Rickettsiella isopodorum]|jgi:membrane fusion protein (multidrug efflux system)|uniref:Efflux transporter periplasmic adaptor subunit n=2 Tax=Candidatus Rickettsiella isopodorum TaxID=1225476 RepID=A0A1J8PAE4_9COXI|nr:efflux transporter periplasmic adaptor subunit [Candidatus Rickettsiella isopodorum]
MIIMLISVGTLFILIFAYQTINHFFIRHAMQKNISPVVTVSAMRVSYSWWQPKILTYGSMRAVNGVYVTTELAGLVRMVYLKPGAEVKEGDVLVQLNADSDVALLHSLEAQEKLAEIIYHRDRAQFAVKAISKAVLDTDEQNLKNLTAQVAQQEAIVAKKTLKAPFSGRLGVSTVNVGQYLNPGDQVVTLQALDPLYADFFIPQQKLVQLHIGSIVNIRTDTYPDKIFTGKVTTINPIVDVNTRNVQIEATIANPQSELYPGMFVSAEVQTSPLKHYLTLPQTAISFNPYGEIAYIVQQKGKDKNGKSQLSVLQTFVTTGEKRGDQIAILDGLKEGEMVVTSGQLKLKNGSLVVINNSVVPNNNPAPVAIDE